MDAQIRTALVANADSTGFWIVLSAMAETTAMTAAAMQAVMKTRMVDPSGKSDSFRLYSIFERKTQSFRRCEGRSQASAYCAAIRPASAASSGVLTLKNGSTGAAGQSAMATPCLAVHTSILCRLS